MINFKNKMIKILQNQLNLNIKKYIIMIIVIKKLIKMIKIITIFSRKKKIIKKKILIKI